MPKSKKSAASLKKQDDTAVLWRAADKMRKNMDAAEETLVQ
jgi:hypothetical protein